VDSSLCGIAASSYTMGFFSKSVFICIQEDLCPLFAGKQMQGLSLWRYKPESCDVCTSSATETLISTVGI